MVAGQVGSAAADVASGESKGRGGEEGGARKEGGEGRRGKGKGRGKGGIDKAATRSPQARTAVRRDRRRGTRANLQRGSPLEKGGDEKNGSAGRPPPHLACTRAHAGPALQAGRDRHRGQRGARRPQVNHTSRGERHGHTATSRETDEGGRVGDEERGNADAAGWTTPPARRNTKKDENARPGRRTGAGTSVERGWWRGRRRRRRARHRGGGRVVQPDNRGGASARKEDVGRRAHQHLWGADGGGGGGCVGGGNDAAPRARAQARPTALQSAGGGSASWADDG